MAHKKLLFRAAAREKLLAGTQALDDAGGSGARALLPRLEIAWRHEADIGEVLPVDPALRVGGVAHELLRRTVPTDRGHHPPAARERVEQLGPWRGHGAAQQDRVERRLLLPCTQVGVRADMDPVVARIGQKAGVLGRRPVGFEREDIGVHRGHHRRVAARTDAGRTRAPGARARASIR